MLSRQPPLALFDPPQHRPPSPVGPEDCARPIPTRYAARNITSAGPICNFSERYAPRPPAITSASRLNSSTTFSNPQHATVSDLLVLEIQCPRVIRPLRPQPLRRRAELALSAS